jgi:hypothetical protein
MEPAREPASSPCQAPPGYWGEDDTPQAPGRTRSCYGPVVLKRCLLLFWAVWLTIVLGSNAADAAKAAGLLDEGWAFASGNYRFVSETTARYGTPGWMNAGMFAGVIAWEGLAAGLFWWAGWKFRSAAGRSACYAAFTTSLLLWGGFMIADEVCIAYAVEGTHLRLFIAQLVTLLTVELLPET